MKVRVAENVAEPDGKDATPLKLLVADELGHIRGVAYVAVGRGGGQCEVRDTESGSVAAVIEAASRDGEGEEDQSIRGLHLFSRQCSETRKLALLSCTASGLVRIHHLPDSPDGSSWQLSTSWQSATGVLATALCETSGQLAVACKGSEVSLWSVETGERTYQAKGAKPNRVGLMDKPWNTAVAFLPGGGGQRVVVGTGQHKVRVYEVSQKRPRISVDFGEGRLTALAPTADGKSCWAADSTGQIGCVDLVAGKVQQLLKGAAGSIRSLALHPTAPLIASAGLDRFLRLHDLASRKSVARVFVKHHLVATMFCPVPDKKLPEAEVAAAAEGLEAPDATQHQAELPRKKKRKAQGGEEKKSKSKKNKQREPVAAST